MSFRLEKIHTKTDNQNWSGVIIDTSTSISSSFDVRDDDHTFTMTKSERLEKVSWFRNLKANLDENYIGWDREYLSDNTLVITYKANTVDSLNKIYINSRKNHNMYTIQWRMYNSLGNEIFKNP
jgi:hypothetical protein